MNRRAIGFTELALAALRCGCCPLRALTVASRKHNSRAEALETSLDRDVLLRCMVSLFRMCVLLSQ